MAPNLRQRAAAVSQANILYTKNLTHPAGKHWDLSANAYVDDPAYSAGYHWDINTYKCVPD